MPRGETLSFLAVLVLLFAVPVIADDIEPVDQGKSPDGQMQVINLHDGNGGYFEVLTSAASLLFSEKSLNGRYPVTPKGAWQALWSVDSQWVAIAFGTTKFSVETVVLHRRGKALELVEIPTYDSESENTHRVPQEWLKNGDLVLAISTGYHTKSDGGIDQYLATIHFEGTPSRGVKRSQTKSATVDGDN
jgi:hypothetical protein